MNSIGIALVWCVIQVTLLAGVAVLVYGLVRRSGPPARALAAFAGLILIVALTGLTFSPWPRWGTGMRPVAAVSDHSAGIGTDGETASDDGGEPSPAEAQGSPVKSTKSLDALSPSAEFFKTLFAEIQRLPAPEKKAWEWPAYVAMLFLIGVVVGLLRLVAGLAAVRSYRLRAGPIIDPVLLETADVLLAELRGPKAIELCESELLATPATIGWRRPLIILPADWKSWTTAECRAVLAHEIAHIARHDFATWVAAQLALVFHFYHPLVHWLAARLRLEQELSADAAAAQLSGGQRLYLTTLAGMALRQSDRPLAWPARTFLPTRGTFMRRIEMLRDEKLLSTKITTGLRMGMLTALAAVSLAVAGLRGTAADRKTVVDQPAVLAQRGDNLPKALQNKKPERSNLAGSAGTTEKSGTSGSTAEGAVEPFSLAWVPRDAIAVAALRPAALFNRPALDVLKKSLLQQKDLQASLGVSPDRIEQVIIIMFSQQDQPVPPPAGPKTVFEGMIFRLAGAEDASGLIKVLQPKPEKREYSGQTYLGGTEGTGPFCFLADERTVVIGGREDHLRRLIVAGKNGASKAKWAAGWKESENADFALLVNTVAIRDMLNQAATTGQPMMNALSGFSPLWIFTSTAVLSADVGEQLSLSLSLSLAEKDGSRTRNVSGTLAAAVTMAQNSLSQARGQFSRLPGEDGASFLRAADILDSLLDSVKIEAKEDQVRATAVVDADDAASLAAMLVPAISKAREAARRAQATNNLRHIGLAMHNYADVNGSFPPAVLYGPDGKTPYSWRVALLPYLEQAPLFEQYKKDEPWDSPANKQVLAKMPAVFRDPNDPAESTVSSYYGLTGPSTIFFGKEGAKFVQITDGTSNTLMLVEAKREIPWTKPEDIPYDKDKPLPKLGGHYAEGFIAAVCDGSVRIIPQNVDQMVLRAFVTRDGGEVIDFSKLENPQPLPVRPPGPTTPRLKDGP